MAWTVVLIWSSGTSRLPDRISSGSLTSPPSGSRPGSATPRSSRTFSREGSSAGQWPPAPALRHCHCRLSSRPSRPPRQKRLGLGSGRGSNYVSLAYSDALITAGVQASVGSVGDSYDNALAETVNGLYKAELIHRRRTWPSATAVEIATLDGVTWWNTKRLHEALDYRTRPKSKRPTLTPRRPRPRPSHHGTKPRALHNGEAGSPFVLIIEVMAVLGLMAVAGVTLVLRSLLRGAIDTRAELEAVV